MESEYSFFTPDKSPVEADNLEGMTLVHESDKGFCRIYTALLHGRRVMVKTLKPEFAASDVHRELLYKEFIIGRDMSHPGIAAKNLMGIAAKTIEQYGKDHEAEEYRHKVASFKRTNMGFTSSYSEWLDEDRLMTHTLQRDGLWAIQVENIKMKRMREQAK